MRMRYLSVSKTCITLGKAIGDEAAIEMAT